MLFSLSSAQLLVLILRQRGIAQTLLGLNIASARCTNTRSCPDIYPTQFH